MSINLIEKDGRVIVEMDAREIIFLLKNLIYKLERLEGKRAYSDDDLLTRKEVAAYLGVSPGTLAVWAAQKNSSLPYIKSHKKAWYRFKDVRKHLEAKISEATA